MVAGRVAQFARSPLAHVASEPRLLCPLIPHVGDLGLALPCLAWSEQGRGQAAGDTVDLGLDREEVTEKCGPKV